MATPAPTTLTRSQYLQIREQIRTLTKVAKNLPLASYAATIEQAQKDGPVKNPKMWTEGAGQLAADHTLAAMLAAFAKSA
jgi:hypothetical protein